LAAVPTTKTKTKTTYEVGGRVGNENRKEEDFKR
jgi:hypothetical protein